MLMRRVGVNSGPVGTWAPSFPNSRTDLSDYRWAQSTLNENMVRASALKHFSIYNFFSRLPCHGFRRSD